jgi:acetylornithine deacetylase/succinyl-diaminopimelate desuccinylase-like protein
MELTANAVYKNKSRRRRTLRRQSRPMRSEEEGDAMTAAEALPKVLDRVDRDLQASLDRLFTLLRIQSISTDPAFAPQCQKAAEHVAADLQSLGFQTSVRPTAGHPVVIGKSATSGNGKTAAANGGAPRVLFYGHYDVQPVDPLDLWQTPPFEPRIETLGDGRKIIVARGACDDKGQAMTFVEACRAFKAVTGALPLDITMMIEGEEECGSKHLFGFVRDNAAELKRDLALVCDTGMWDGETPSITTSLRGLVYEEVRLICADRDLHSGLFGGAARNPIHVLADIIAALHKPDGSVAIPGFYDGVQELPKDIKADLAGLGLTPEKFLGQVGLKIPAGEKDRMLIEQISTRPTAEVNGIIGGYTGDGAKTVIPGKAMAKVSFRLVGAQDPEKIRSRFREFVRARVPADCTVEFGNFTSAPAFEVAFDSPALGKARAALGEEWGRKAVTVGGGGSIPIVGDFKTVLGMDTLMVGFALDDDRVHSPNEKYDLKCFHKGIRSWARILAALAG